MLILESWCIPEVGGGVLYTNKVTTHLHYLCETIRRLDNLTI